MKKLIAPFLLSGLLCLGFQQSDAQNLGDLLNAATGKNKSTSKTGNANSNAGNANNNVNPNGNKNSLLGAGLSNTDIAGGLKEALKIGAQNAAKQLSAPGGYLQNAAIKILLPPEAQKVEQTLRSLGLGSIVDKAIVSMNRAAEDAAVKSAPIFIDAITSISIQDGVNILRAGNFGATNYLKGKTTGALTSAFSPVIKQSLDKVNAPALWNKVFSTYNKLSPTKVNPDLTGYVTERALSGLFTTIGNEESKIRSNPAAQVTSLLQKVFGN
jgi:hypothetical protein